LAASGNRLGRVLYQFGGNKPALLMGSFALFIALVTAIGAITLEDAPICVPAYAGAGQPGAFGKVIVGQVVERDERLDGCKALAVRVRGYALPKFGPGPAAFEAATNSTPAEAVLVLSNLPARYQGLAVGTQLMALYNEAQETPLAFSFPNGAGLELGSDTRADYGKLRLLLYAVTAFVLLVGSSILLIAWYYPVERNRPALTWLETNPPPINKKPRRPPADPITGERPDEEPPRPRFQVEPDRLPKALDKD